MPSAARKCFIRRDGGITKLLEKERKENKTTETKCKKNAVRTLFDTMFLLKVRMAYPTEVFLDQLINFDS